MLADEVLLNGKRLCVAGTGKGYVSAYVTHLTEETDTWIDVVGLDDRKKGYVRWARTDLHEGDGVLVKIASRTKVDKYKITRRHDPIGDVACVKRYVRTMAKAFGWEIRIKRGG